MGKTKKFINKKSSLTFQLMPRDSTDPAFTQSDDRVFVRVDNNPISADSVFADSPDDPDADTEDGFDDGSGPLSDDVRKDILELGFPDDGYNYLTHLREIKNAGGGSFFYSNPKFKLQHVPRDVKAYDASRLRIKEADEEPEENTLYTVASKTASVRVQKAVDPEVAALLDDSDVSRFGSDVEDLEEDFVVQANLHEDKDDEEEAPVCNGMNFAEGSTMNRSLNNDHVLQVSAYSTIADDCKSLDEGVNGVTGVQCAGEKSRPRRLLDEQFDLLEQQEYGSDDNSGDDDYDDDYEENYGAEDESLAEKLKLSLSNHEMESLEVEDDGKYKVPADLLKKDAPGSEGQEDSAADVIRRCKEYGEQYEVEDEDKDVVIFQESSDESEAWDCETIVSTYSNLDNLPGKIEIPGATRKKKLAETITAASSSTNPIIFLRGKAKLPVDFLPAGRRPAAENVRDSTARPEQYRRRQHGQESKEEKKERKTAVKEERREARRTKKEMKELYKCEAHRAQRVSAVAGPSSFHLL
ncbi:uncharacterized protein [Cicer arietinum]|uniref:Protein LTV1 homolog isoform X1 n=1 Tax=Cicer arietinum TaxID=3827 RepID=A0A1S2YTB6_CICAR|nr:protein LTV1 homolog isoform X1 [Cicer arietinum]XP_027192810.1 protein LTV1 homolog isoform X2 [Cicer arietinum]